MALAKGRNDKNNGVGRFMRTNSQNLRRLDLASDAASHQSGAAPSAPVVATLPVRAETRIAVLTADPLLAFAVTALCTSHFSTVTVMSPELDDLRAARHLDSRSHALIILDAPLISQLGPETLGAWLRPFRAVPALLLSATPNVQTLDHFQTVKAIPRDVSPRGLAESIRLMLKNADQSAGERRARPQEIDRITATQWRVIGYLGNGHSNKEIAFRMGISEATVKAHVGAAIARLGLTNRTEVALFAQRLALGSRWTAMAADVDAPT